MSIDAVSGSSLARYSAPSNAASEVVSRSGGGLSSSVSATGGAVESAYVSPIIKFDSIAKMAVLYFRDGDSGEIYQQIPAEKVVKEYRLRGGRSIEETPVVARALTASAAGGADRSSVSTSQASASASQTSSGASRSSTANAGASADVSGSTAAPVAQAGATDSGSVGSTLSVSV